MTCLVGKNEAGKSAVLQAIGALNPHPATPMTLKKERDYPARWLNDYGTRHAGHQAKAMDTEWQLEPADVAAVQAVFGAKVLTTETMNISRRFEAQSEDWNIVCSSKSAIEHLLSRANVIPCERSDDSDSQSINHVIHRAPADQ